ncbi:hypothetical protein [Candidatus Phytoplasma oryzae]|nr:hypothetical protein PIE28_01805 [Candidatus Phytoplasma oryzae]
MLNENFEYQVLRYLIKYLAKAKTNHVKKSLMHLGQQKHDFVQNQLQENYEKTKRFKNKRIYVFSRNCVHPPV